MAPIAALVDWPSAPLTDRIVRGSLAALRPPPQIVPALPQGSVSETGDILQWSTYDSLDHNLTYSPPPGSKVLASSYTIRKALIRKHYLSRCIHQFLTKHPKSSLIRAAPKTWELELSFSDELEEMWNDELYGLGLELDQGSSDKWWILKPGMADRGMGIRLFHTKDELVKIFAGFELSDDEDECDGDGDGTAVVTSQLRHFVLQEYLSNPLLIDPSEVPLDGNNILLQSPAGMRGHKFHCRVYCVASGALTVYMYTRILTLFSTVPYTSPEEQTVDADEINRDLSSHLTNTSLQKERGEAGVRLLDELAGCHILSSYSDTSLPVHSHQTHFRTGPIPDATSACAVHEQEMTFRSTSQMLTVKDIAQLKIQIADVLAETFKAALDMSVHFQPVPNAFELFGVDFLVTHDRSSSQKFQVHLLEVNSEPAIELTGPRLTWILEDLFRAIGKVCVAPFFDPSTTHKDGDTNTEGWSVGETREMLTKCLEIEVRGARGW